MKYINAGSQDAVFYADEAQARLEANDVEGALLILDKAEKNGCVDDYTQSIRASVLQQTDPEQAAVLRMKYIEAGSQDAVFCAGEAKARLEAGDVEGALFILDKAEQNRCANEYTQSIRARVLKRRDSDMLG